jgi:hypothetical protein
LSPCTIHNAYLSWEEAPLKILPKNSSTDSLAMNVPISKSAYRTTTHIENEARLAVEFDSAVSSGARSAIRRPRTHMAMLIICASVSFRK